MEFSTLNGYKVKDKKAIRFYDNVESMKNDTSLKSGMHVKTKGYYSINDGGSAEYVIKTSSSGYYEEISNELVAELVLCNENNVKQYGAKGDGETDDTLSLKNAFSSSNNLFINNGTYIINDELEINTDKVVKGETESLIKAKSGMRTDKAIIKIIHDNVTLDGVKLSGNISENPIGDTYNSEQGISLIDSVDVSNITIKNCILKDNAYCGYRIRSSEPSTNISHIMFINNKCLNIDCGIISLSSSTNTMILDDVHITNNTFDGHSKSEPVSIFHYGTSNNISITDNIMCNKSHANGVLFDRNTSNNVMISNNIMNDLATGIKLNNVTNGNISNNTINSISSNFFQGIMLINCNHIKVNNNITNKTANEALLIQGCQYIYANDNVFNGINVTEDSTYKEAIDINSSTYVYTKNNIANRYNTTNSYLYYIHGNCNHLYIDEENNSSNVTFGFDLKDLSDDLTDSNIKTNLNIRSNFTPSRLASNTNKIVQTYSTVQNGVVIGSSYRFAREIPMYLASTYTFSTFQIYNLVDYDVYTLNMNVTGTVTLTSDTSSDYGVTWKSDRNITSPTQIKLMYLNGKLYEI